MFVGPLSDVIKVLELVFLGPVGSGFLTHFAATATAKNRLQLVATQLSCYLQLNTTHKKVHIKFTSLSFRTLFIMSNVDDHLVNTS
jgi:hypothetical protein